jgi:cell division protein FtsB
MSRGSEPSIPERARQPDRDALEDDAPGAEADAGAAGPLDLSSLPIAGLTRARLLSLAALLAAGWLAIAFSRQVGAAGDLSARADALRDRNAALETQVAELQDEIALVQRLEYIGLQARGHRLGSPLEIPFTLEAQAPSLPADAPGSAALRLGADSAPPGPLEAWLTILFAPSG